MLFSVRKCELEIEQNIEHIQRATFSIVLPVLRAQPNFAKLYRIMNTSLVGVKSEYLYLGGINILVESRYLAQINTLPFYFHLKPPILICVVRVIQRRYILIQNTFITEARYGKFFSITALLPLILTMLVLQTYSEERHYARICQKTHSLSFGNFGFLN